MGTIPTERLLLTEATGPWRRDDLPTGDLPGLPSVRPRSLAELRSAGLVGERLEHFDVAERARAERLGALGIDVHSVGRTHLFPTPDALIVGSDQTLEVKAPEAPTFNAFRRAVRKARYQSPRLALFTTELAVSEDQALVWLRRSLGRYGGGYVEVLVVGDDFGILWP